MRRLARCFGVGLVSSGKRCYGEMEVYHHLLDLLLGSLELVGELLVGAGKVSTASVWFAAAFHLAAVAAARLLRASVAAPLLALLAYTLARGTLL